MSILQSWVFVVLVGISFVGLMLSIFIEGPKR